MKKIGGIFVISCLSLFGIYSSVLAFTPSLGLETVFTDGVDSSEMADLEFSAYGLNDTQLFYTIENVGNIAVVGKVYMQWVDENYLALDDGGMTFWSLTEIPAGESSDVVLSLTNVDSSLSQYLANPHFNARYLHLVLDPKDEVSELNEVNNSELVELPLADLVYSSVALTDTELSYTIENNGTKAAIGKTYMQWVDEDYLGVSKSMTYWSKTEIPGGETKSLTLSLTNADSSLSEFLASPPFNAKYLHLLLDPDDEVMELDETNNHELVDIALADLSFASFALTDTELSYTIQNTGTKAAVGKTWMQWVDEDYIAVSNDARTFWLTSEIPAGGTSDIELSLSNEGSSLSEYLANPSFNAKYLHIVLDPTDEVPELDDANNHELIPLSLADLSFSSVVLTDTKLTYTIQNTGTKAAVGKTWMQWVDEDFLSINDDARTFWHTSPIPAGETSDVILAFTTTDSSLSEYLSNPPIGAQYLHLLLDPDDEVPELDDANNHKLVAQVFSGATGLHLLDLDKKLIEKKINSKDPKWLPDSKLYFVKSAGRAIRSAFTFSPRKQADLNRQYANDMILETSRLVTKGSIEEAVMHLQRYEKEIEKVEKVLDKLQEKDPLNFEEFLFGFTNDQINHQFFVNEVKEAVSDEFSDDVLAVQTRSLENLDQVLTRVEDSQKLDVVIKDAFGSDGSPFMPMQTLEVIKLVERVIPKSGREALSKVEDDVTSRFSRQLDILSVSEQQVFVEYVDNAGGDNDSYVSILDVVALEEVSEDTRSVLESVEVRLLTAVENEVEVGGLEESAESTDDQDQRVDVVDLSSPNVVVEEAEREVEVEEDVVREVQAVESETERETEIVVEDEVEDRSVVEEEESERETVVEVEEEVVESEREAIVVEEEEEEEEVVESERGAVVEEVVVEERETESVVVEEEEVVEEVVCTEDVWECGDWSECSAEGSQTRSCRLTDDCSAVTDRSPDMEQRCTAPVVEEEEETESRSSR